MRSSVFPAFLLLRAVLLGVAACCSLSSLRTKLNAVFAAVGMILLFGMGVARAQLPAITRAEVISTVAGHGDNYGCVGDGGLATSAELYYNFSLAFSSTGDLYIIDYQCETLRKVDAKTGFITTVAGTANTTGYTGDGGLAVNALLNQPTGVWVDGGGNIFIADSGNSVVRKINSQGVITTVAGGGASGVGDGGPATRARLNYPLGLVTDSAGNLYIADNAANRIRKVDGSGTITTIAGTGIAGSTGDGGLATSAKLNGPDELALDAGGNLFVTDNNNNRVRVISPTGYINNFAGDGTASSGGDNAPAINAQINSPSGIAVDTAGNVYVAEQSGFYLREIVRSTGVIITLAGSGSYGTNSGDNGLATASVIEDPSGMALDRLGNLYFNTGPTVRKINPATGTLTFLNTPVGATSATQELILLVHDSTTSIASIAPPLSQSGVAEYAVTSNSCPLNSTLSAGTICSLTLTFSPAFSGARPTPLIVLSTPGPFQFGMQGSGTEPEVALTPGSITTVAGTGVAGYGGDGGAALAAQLNNPSFVTMSSAGILYVSDSGNNRVRSINTISNLTGTIVGNGAAGATGDGALAANAEINGPAGVATDSAGNLFFADHNNNSIREVNANTGIITTIAGGNGAGYTGDGGLATSAQLHAPNGVAVDVAGTIYIADSGNNAVRTVTAGTIATVAGTGVSGFGGDNGPGANAQLASPYAVAVDSSENLYVSDFGNNRVRKIDPAGVISTVAGDGTAGSTGDGGPATSAGLNGPSGLKIDGAGNLYVSDLNNRHLRKVESASGIISTVAGSGAAGSSGDNGPATSAKLNHVEDLALDGSGNLYLTDAASNVIRKVDVHLGSLAYAATGVNLLSSDSPQSITVSNVGNAALLFTVPSSGLNPAVSTHFSIENSSTCPRLNTGSSPATLATGVSCSFLFDFTPTAIGSLTGSGVLTDNVANVPSSTQTIHLSGIGVYPTQVAISLGTSVYGQTTVFATVTALGSSQLPVGSVVFTVDGTSEPSTPLNGSAVATLLASVSNALRGGTHSVSAAYTTSVVQFANSTAAGSITVTPAVPVVTSTISPTTPAYGQAAIITLTAAAGGFPVPGSTASVTIAGQTYTCTTNASGQCTVSVPAGVLQGGSDAITLATTATSDAVAGTGTSSVTVTATTPVVTSTISPATPAYGQAATVMVTATAAGIPVSGSTGTVTVGGHSYTCTTNSLGQCTVTVPGGVLQGGSDTVAVATSATANAAAGSSTSSVTVTPVPPVVTAGISPASPTYGQPAIVTVTATAGGIPQSGSMGTVTVGSHTYTCTTGSTGQCTVSVLGGVLQGGTNTVTVATGATANAAAGSGSSTVTVAPAAAVVTASVNPAIPVYGQAAIVTVTATVAGIAQAGDTGTVTVQGQIYTCITSALGQCAVIVPAGVLQGGSNTITLATAATANGAAGTGTAVVAVSPAAAAVSATISPASPAYGQPATVTVTATAGGVPVSGSTATVTVEGHSYTCTTNASGQCTVAVPAGVLQGGNDTVTVATSGTANAGAGAGTSSVTVTPVAPVVTAGAAPASPTYGQAATITVTSLAAGFPVSAAAATVSVGGQNYTCTTNASGQCTVQVPGGAMQGGNDTVTVASGATANASAGSGSSTITVAPGTPVVTLSVSPAAPVYGQAASISMSVSAGSAFVPGSVLTVTVGGQPYTCTTNASGSCAVTVPAGVLTAGSDAFAVSTGATSDALAGSATGTVTVALAPATLTITSSAASVTEGDPVTLSATLISGTNGVPTGTVIFYFNGAAIGTGTLSGGVAALTLSTLPTGADAITAVYGGDVDFSPATAAAFSETVLVPSFTIAVASGAPPAASVAPGGTVTFPLSLGTINGFTGSLIMSATGLPPGATATFTPEDVVLSGPNAGNTTLTIVTPLAPPATAAVIRYGWLLLPLLLLRLRGKARLFSCTLLIPLAMLAGLTGCGGGYSGQSSTSYVVTVTATSGTISHSTTVTLTVQ